MDRPNIKREDVLGIEPKHITYVLDQKDGQHDCLVVKEVIHLKDGTKVPRLKLKEDYERPFWITHKGLQNHQEKKDYELLSNLQEYKCKQFELTKRIAQVTRNFSAGPNPYLRQLARSPYLYGADISSSALLKNDYHEKYPNVMSLNLVAGGDIETNVVRSFRGGEDVIICMSVSHKEQVRLVYLKDWVADIDNPIEQTHLKAQALIGDLIKERNLSIEVLIADTPAQIVTMCIDKLHEWKPDFWSFWNMDFDMSKILRALNSENINPADVFTDPTVPDRYKFFEYKKGQSKMTTASGKDKTKGPEDIWNWVTCPATFQPIDAMTTYRITRLADGKESSYALDAILSKELNYDKSVVVNTQADMDEFKEAVDEALVKHRGGFIYLYRNGELLNKTDNFSSWAQGDEFEIEVDYRKLKFPEVDHLTGLRWHEEMQSNYKIEYGIYNIVDSVRLEQLDEKTKDLASSISMYSKNSDYKNFNSNPKRLIDDMHFWYLNRKEPCVIGTTSDQMLTELDALVVSHKDWIITLPSYMVAPEGMRCIEEMPHYKSLIYCHVADLDIVSTYPNVSQILNIARETCVMELSAIKGIPERWKREIGVNLTGGKTNAIEICQKIMGMPKLDALLAAYKDHRSKKSLPGLGVA